MSISTKVYDNKDVEIVVEKFGTKQVFEISYINSKEVPTVRVIAEDAKVRILKAGTLATDMSTIRL